MSKNNNTKCVTANKEANVTLVELIWGSPG